MLPNGRVARTVRRAFFFFCWKHEGKAAKITGKLVAEVWWADVTKSGNEVVRCRWAANEWNIPYHDEEWGVPVHDEKKWLEFLILEGAQAGLSWDTILRKRQRYREVLDGFDPEKIARYGAKKVRELLSDPGIIRNRLKVEAAIGNARAFLKVQEEFETFDKYIWRFVGGAPKQNTWKAHEKIPARTAESDAVSKDLQKRGFRFVGSTICYALMQATGMVNDHVTTCFRYPLLRVK
jgi:DNA-3-methyladenine glycosylase I